MNSYIINQTIDDNNDGYINDNSYYDELIDYYIEEINSDFNKKEYEENMYTYIVYCLFNAVIYKLIVGEKKMYEMYGPKSNVTITKYDDINSID